MATFDPESDVSLESEEDDYSENDGGAQFASKPKTNGKGKRANKETKVWLYSFPAIRGAGFHISNFLNVALAIYSSSPFVFPPLLSLSLQAAKPKAKTSKKAEQPAEEEEEAVDEEKRTIEEIYQKKTQVRHLIGPIFK